jgi:two-component system cell cycle sensor histidine kinase/response regulator CckA
MANHETALLDACALGILITQGRTCVYVNRPFCGLFGYDPSEVIGRDPITFIHADDQPHTRQRLGALMRGEVKGTQSELRVLRRDGTAMSVFVASSPCTFEGRPAVLSTVVDLVGIRRSLGFGARAADMQIMSRLAGGIAHDFNNLLLVIGGHTERLLAAVNDEPARSSVLAIKEAAERASLLTDQLLSFGRQQVLSPETLDLSLVVQELEELLRRRVGDTIQLKIERPRRLPPVRMDRARLTQVLLHLVDSARENMPHGGTIAIIVDWMEADEDVRRTRRWLPSGWYVRLQVVDDGVGVSPEALNHLFEPFFEPRPGKTTPGMGLAMVYGLVKQSKGFIYVDSLPGDGTRVSVLLPPAMVAQSEVGRAASDSPPPKAGRTPFVLLVEDEAAVRELLTETLRQSGFEVVAAASSEEALRGPAERPVDVLVADVDLPGISGPELAAAMRQRHPNVGVILMSGFGGDVMTGSFMEHDRVTLLRKPFPSAALLARVREMTK